MSISITPQGYAVLDEYIQGSCSDYVRVLGRIDHDPFGSIDLCRPFWKPGSTVIDVGANIGCWSVPMAEAVGPEGCVISFEGDPETCECLIKNLESYPQAKALNAAVWDTTEYVPFRINHGNRECGAVFLSTGDPDTVVIPGIRLDDISPAPSGVSFIKVDVEGAELHVLRGADKLITRKRPVLFLETLEHAQNYYGNTLNDMYHWLENRGYLLNFGIGHDVLAIPP